MIINGFQNINGYQLNVGLSSIIGITTVVNQSWLRLRNSSGGTLWVGGATLSWGQGYQMRGAAAGVDCVTDFPGLFGTVYLAAAGATAIVDVLVFLTSPNDAR